MMKRVLVFLFSVSLFILLLSFSGKNSEAQRAQIRTLIIDPGHGGIDPGARGEYSTEAEVSLAVAMKNSRISSKQEGSHGFAND